MVRAFELQYQLVSALPKDVGGNSGINLEEHIASRATRAGAIAGKWGESRVPGRCNQPRDRPLITVGTQEGLRLQSSATRN